MWRRGWADATKAVNQPLARAVIVLLSTSAAAAGAIWVAQTKKPTILEYALGAAAGVVTGPLVVGLCLLAWKCGRAPFEQRKDARDEIERLRHLLFPEFPPRRLDTKRPWEMTLPDNHPDAGKHVLLIPIEYTNRDPSRKVSLEFEVYYTLRDLGTHRLLPYRHLPLPEVIEDALAVDPQPDVRDKLLCLQAEEWLFETSDPDHWELKPDVELSLRVTDHVTGAMIEQPVQRRRDQER